MFIQRPNEVSRLKALARNLREIYWGHAKNRNAPAHDPMTASQKLAEYISHVTHEDLSKRSMENLKIRILDSLACAFGALPNSLIEKLRHYINEIAERGACSTIGGGTSSPEHAAFFNSALIRYLDFNDSFLAPGETCHPSDNLGPVLAAAEYAHRSGKDLLIALALAYQVQCRLSEEAPVRAKGFDHTTQGTFAVAAGVSKALSLDEIKTTHALGIAGTAFHALRVTRTGRLSHWKGLAYPNMAFGVVHACLLAMRGITGPIEVFEGNKGFMDSIAGPFHLNWDLSDLSIVDRTILKKYNSEIHSQTTIEAILALRPKVLLNLNKILRIEAEIFDVAYKIIGGGEEGPKTSVTTKEEADHSLPYLISVALLDGKITKEQYRPERIQRWDVQTLIRKIRIIPSKTFSERFPSEMPSQVRIFLEDGTLLTEARSDYDGFVTRPSSWQSIETKFYELTKDHLSDHLARRVIMTVRNLEHVQNISELTQLIREVHQNNHKTGEDEIHEKLG